MKIFYLSTALTDEIYQRITGRCRRFKPTFSGVGFDRNVAAGLSGHGDVEAVSYYPIPSYPKYRGIWEQSDHFQTGALRCFVPGMLDLPVVKEWVFSRAAVKHFRSCDTEDAVILVSGLYRCLLRPARLLKRRYGLKIYAIVPDVPEIMRTYRKDYTPLRRFLNRLDVENSKKYRDCVDGFVLLSSHMNPIVNPEGKPWIQVDGMCDLSKALESHAPEQENREPYLLYAGKLSEKFGVDRLIRAFQRAELPGCKLYLCGDGDLTEAVRGAAEQDERIRYLGLVPHDRVLELERGAALLVEPRPTEDPLTKLSFPSKILEYMASGTPVLTTALPCFSQEYEAFQFRIREETDDGIRDALEQTMALPADQRREMGRRAQAFVAQNKSIDVQCARIASFIKGENH